MPFRKSSKKIHEFGQNFGGKVKLLNRLKGFGFITPADADVISDILFYVDGDGDGYRNLYEEDSVRYDVRESDYRGNPIASNLRK